MVMEKVPLTMFMSSHLHNMSVLVGACIKTFDKMGKTREMTKLISMSMMISQNISFRFTGGIPTLLPIPHHSAFSQTQAIR